MQSKRFFRQIEFIKETGKVKHNRLKAKLLNSDRNENGAYSFAFKEEVPLRQNLFTLFITFALLWSASARFYFRQVSIC